MRLRVVCGLAVTIATFSPVSAFSSVLLPAFGRPRMATKPDFNRKSLLHECTAFTLSHPCRDAAATRMGHPAQWTPVPLFSCSPGPCFLRQRRGIFLRRRKDTQPIDAPIGGCNHLDAQSAVLKQNNLAGQGNAAFDLAHQAAERRRLVVPIDLNGLAEEPRDLVDRVIAGNQPDTSGLALRVADVAVFLVLVAKD